jgi:hypothetical protein
MLDEIFKTTSHQETLGHPPYQLKDLNHILLAYYTDPKLFEDKRAQIE